MRRRTLSLGLASPAAMVWMLGVTQVIGYGTVYYSIAILTADIAATFQVPVSWIFGAFSLSLLAGGFAAPMVGRRIDRHGAGAVMSIGSLAASAMLVAAALAPELISFVVALIALQIASALILYDAAFAALVQSYGSQGRSRITQLTLIAGFASTLFWPLTTWLDGVMDWRQVFLVFAALNFALCLPLHLILKIAPPKPETEPAPADPGEKPHVQHAPVPKHLQRRVLVLVTAGFALSGFMLSAVLAQMVPVLTALGIGSVSLWIAALFGPAQVLVRLVSMMFGVRRHPLFMTLIASSMLPLAVMILTLSAPMTAGAVAFSILLGFGSGLKSIVQGALPLALFGSASYGTRLGQIALPRQVLAAVAPFAFAFMVDTAGQTTAMVVLVVIAGFGLAAFVEVARLQKRLE